MNYVVRVSIEFDKTPKELAAMCKDVKNDEACPSRILSMKTGMDIWCPFGARLCKGIRPMHWEAIRIDDKEFEE